MKPLLIFISSIIITSSLTGCDNKEPETQSALSATEQSSQRPRPPKVITPDQLNADKIHSEKMRIYIDCINSLRREFDDSFMDYHSWIKDLQQGPTGSENPREINEINRTFLTNCDKNISQLQASITSPEPVDKLAIDYISKATTLAGKISEMSIYYKQENYKDDNFAKGKALHAEWLKFNSQFEVIANAWYATMQTLVDEQRQKTLEENKSLEQKTFRNYALEAMMLSYEIQQTIEKKDVDLAAVREKASKLDSVIAELKASDKEGRESSFIEETANLQTQAIKYARRMKQQTPYSGEEKQRIDVMGMDYTVDGSCAAVLHQYNRLVFEYNGIARGDTGDDFLYDRHQCTY